MRHPNLPYRRIRHAQIMRKAGFVIDEGWMNLNKNNPPNPNSNVAKLIYWKHPTLKMSICIHDYEQIALSELVNRVYEQARYWFKKSVRIEWDKIT